MSKIFFQYNSKTLSYERVYISLGQKIWIVFRQLVIGVGIGALLFGIATYAFDSPREQQLKKDNKLLLTQYEVLRRRIAENEKILSDLQQRDDLLYRAIFNADPIPESIRRQGFGGTNRYESLLNMPNSDLIISTTRNLDIMTKELYVQSNSYDELIKLIKNKDERMKSIPAIVPISLKTKSNFLRASVCEFTRFAGIGTCIPVWISLPTREALFMQPVTAWWSRPAGMGDTEIVL